MNKLAELWSDIVQCWSDSSMQYLTGALKTIELAVIATIIGLSLIHISEPTRP